jgi:hypothetical protein
MPLRPDADQRLDPWTETDVRRLKLDPTPELIQAVKTTWNQTGGTR